MLFKIKILSSIIIINFLFFLLPISGISFDYVINDTTVYPIVEMPKPAKGVPFEEPLFHTQIVRITDVQAQFGSGCHWIQTGYPKADSENADGTYLILQAQAGSTWFIFNANPPWNMIQQIPIAQVGQGVSIYPRWDATDPDVLYYERSGNLWKYNVSTNTSIMIHKFAGEVLGGLTLAGASEQDEGTPSDDSRYWAMQFWATGAAFSPAGILVFDKDFNGLNNGKIISYHIYTSAIGSSECWANPLTCAKGYASMTPDGKWVQVGDHHAIYSRDFSYWRDGKMSAHADLAYSREGRLVISGFTPCGVGAQPPVPIGAYYCAGMEDVESGILTKLPIWIGGLSGGRGYHFSGNSHEKPGWSVVSTYPGPGSTWNDTEIDMIELTTRTNPPPRVWRLAKTRTVNPMLGYQDAPFAKINKRGTKIWFVSGWGKSMKSTDGYLDVYQINLPSTWYQDLSNLIIKGDTAPPAAPKGLKILN